MTTDLQAPGAESQKAKMPGSSACPSCGYNLDATTTPICPECGTSSTAAERVHRPPIPLVDRLACVVIVGIMGAGVGLGSLSSNGPSAGSPCGAFAMIPWMIAGKPIAFAVCMTISVAFASPLLSKRRRPTFWSLLPSLTVIALATAYFLYGASFGVQYQGPSYVVTCGLAGVIAIVLLAGSWIAARRNASYFYSFLHFVILVIWMNSFAFAYMGELP